MKKRIILSMVLVLMLVGLTPAPALAKVNRVQFTTQSFSATAMVAVTDAGKSIPKGAQIKTRGEIIEGTFVNVENWPAMEGASLKVRHNSEITLAPDGTFQGSANALVTVTPVDGGMLFGIYEAVLTGEYTVMADGQLVILWVQDAGTFRVRGRILGEDRRTFVTAEGEWDAALLLTQVGPDIYTLAGQAQMSGEYRTLGR